ncbi:MAG: lipopolysaccharide heptosyltransferase II [Candidatus Eisenbacteria bacterium]
MSLIRSVKDSHKPGAKKVSLGVRAPNWLGDAILALPAVQGLVECSRRARVIVLASTASYEVFSRVRGTLVFPIRRPGAGPVDSMRATFKGASILRTFRPVITFSFTRSFTSAAMFLVGGSTRRVGFSDSSFSSFYTDRVDAPGRDREHLTDTYCRLVESMGIKVMSRIPELKAAQADLRAGRRVLEHQGLGTEGYVCVFPGARYGPAKRWDTERFASLGDILVDRFSLRVLLLGTTADEAACTAVEERMTKESINLCGRLDFSELVGLLSGSSAVVSNDSGGMHLAASLGVPTVGLFFSTDPRWTRPLSPGSIALYNRMKCSPCFARDCRRGTPCTRTITVDEVTGALAKIGGIPT